ncbi:hypothetical protein FB451DRAFT_1174665 [Mycena latifolia]|nr:hypothetical protein FB451DRAFT_1174665 [Mycena latifolia]
MPVRSSMLLRRSLNAGAACRHDPAPAKTQPTLSSSPHQLMSAIGPAPRRTSSATSPTKTTTKRRARASLSLGRSSRLRPQPLTKRRTTMRTTRRRCRPTPSASASAFTSTSSSKSPAPRKPVAGPTMPPGSGYPPSQTRARYDADSDDDDVGPARSPQAPVRCRCGAELIAKEEKRRRSSSELSLWTETPAERAQRLADEVSGRKRRAANAPADGDEADTKEGLEARKRAHVDAALVDMHAESAPGSPDGRDLHITRASAVPSTSVLPTREFPNRNTISYAGYVVCGHDNILDVRLLRPGPGSQRTRGPARCCTSRVGMRAIDDEWRGYEFNELGCLRAIIYLITTRDLTPTGSDVAEKRRHTPRIRSLLDPDSSKRTLSKTTCGQLQWEIG